MGLRAWMRKKMLRNLTRETEPKRGYLCDFDRICQEIIPGDVLLVEGRNRISNIIRNVTNSTWTHSALYIGRLHSIEDAELRKMVQKSYKGAAAEQLLIESKVGFGTVITPITFYQHNHIRICRPQGLSHSDAQKVIGHAVRHLGNVYNKRQIFDLMSYMLATPFIPSRWHSNLFRQPRPNQTTKEICSTMIAQAFGSVKFPIKPIIKHHKNKIEFIERNPKLITPRDFDYSPYFAIIKYPLFGNKGAYYHNMPWAAYSEENNTKDDE